MMPITLLSRKEKPLFDFDRRIILLALLWYFGLIITSIIIFISKPDIYTPEAYFWDMFTKLIIYTVFLIVSSKIVNDIKEALK